MAISTSTVVRLLAVLEKVIKSIVDQFPRISALEFERLYISQIYIIIRNIYNFLECAWMGGERHTQIRERINATRRLYRLVFQLPHFHQEGGS